jgi:hypothetical protein
MPFHRAALPLSSRTLTFVAGIVRRHRAAIGSGWRKLNPAKQALLVLVYLRKGETFASLAAGFGVGTATAWRVPKSQRQAGKAHAKLRSPGERANAQLKTWKVLNKLRCCPSRADQLARAIHVLRVREAKAG